MSSEQDHAGAVARAVASAVNAIVEGGGWISVSDAAEIIQAAIDAVVDERTAALAGEVARLRKALLWYGDCRNYTPDVMDHWPSRVQQDWGVIARAALGAPGGQEEATSAQ